MASGQFDDEVEPTISIHEYLEELEADLELEGDEGKECTYTQGYLKRQAIFSCLTCTPDGNAGVCTACSLSCHDSHEVVELWTKRDFRCDCGNSKFGLSYCKLCPNKDIKNVENSYNHNFKGSYCTCGLPYPDPDVEDQVEMMQCCMCEDWFHEEHLGLESPGEIPRNEEGEPLYEDFICQACSGVCSFLVLYPQTIWAAGKQCDATANNTKDKDVSEYTSVCLSEQLETDLANNKIAKDNFESRLGEEISDKNVALNGCDEDGNPNPCVVGVDLLVACPALENKPFFLNKSWRDTLCRCDKCLKFYNKKGIAFLLDKDDSIVEYEKIAKQKRKEKLQQQEGDELSLFNKLGHVEKIEILHGIEDMKNEITSFLESFDSSKPITSDDIHHVFENLAKKRRRN